jgi:hypothetical protein
MYPDPVHTHYDMEGNKLDGQNFKALNTIATYTSLEPSLDTCDLTYHHHFIITTSRKENWSQVPLDVLVG